MALLNFEKALIFAFALLFSLMAVKDAAAEIFVYTAPDGTIEFTNVPTNKKFKPLHKGGWTRSSKTITTPKPAAVKQQQRAPEQNRQGPFRHRGDVSLNQISKEIQEYMPIIKEASAKYRIPVSLIKAVIYAESGWDKDAVSVAGAEGLMQLMPATAKDLGVTDSFDPYQNIMGGTLYLRQLANRFNGDVVLMVASYNAGQNRVAKTYKVPKIPETIDYTRKVLKMYRRFKQEEEEKAKNSYANL